MKAIYKLFFSLLAAAFAAAVSSCTAELEEQSIVSGLRPLSITTSIVEAQEVKGRAPIHTGKEFKAGDRIEFFGSNIYTADGNAINSFHAVMQDNGQWTFSPEVMVGPEPAGISAYTLAGPNDVVDMVSVGYPKEYYALYNGNPEVNFYFRHTKALVSFDIIQEGWESGVLTSAQLVDLGELHIVGSFCDGLEKNAKYFLTNISTACPGVSKNETDDSKIEEAKAEYAEILAFDEKSYYDLCIPNWRYSLDSNGSDVVNMKSHLIGEPLRVSFLNIPIEVDGKEGRAALQLVIDDKTYQVEIPATEWVGGKHYIYPVKVDLSQPADKVLSISDATIEGWGEATDLPGVTIGDIINPKEHEYVDLGLPSGTLWATCNIGANSPEEYGDYFAWGEIETKQNFGWSNYKWCKGTETSITKYCTNDGYGAADNIATLELEDDVAYKKWGAKWRIPTRQDFKELYDECVWTWTIINGVNGYKVSNKRNGNFIFLPVTGGHEYFNRYNIGEGRYWYSSVSSYSPNYAENISFDEGDVTFYFATPRCHGLAIRAICVK